MKLFRNITLLFVFMMANMPVSAKDVMLPKAYMFGFVASFNDSIVFFTDIQEVDSVWVLEKKELLAGRSSYAYQLREFFTNSFNMPNRTCIVISDKNRKNVEKKYAKMKKIYVEKGANKYDVHYTNSSEFRFHAVNMDDSTTEPQTNTNKKSSKKEKAPKPKRPKK